MSPTVPEPSPEPERSFAREDARNLSDHARVVRELFREHNRSLVSFLAARLHSEADARDVAQEAYVRMLQLEKPAGVSFLRSYLYRIAENLVVDRVRRRKVREQGEVTATEIFEDLLTQPSAERRFIAKQQIELLKAALRELPDKCRQAFALHYFAERPISAIARELNLTERMIRIHIARGLAHCRQRLDEAGDAIRRQVP